jgi:hypothetical protein
VSCDKEVKPPAHIHPDTMQIWSLHFKMTMRKWSKMVTMIQKQIAWTPNPAEMLEPHLAEVKHQSESNLSHPESLASGRHPQNMLHIESLRAATTTTAAATVSKPTCETFYRLNRCEHHASHGIPPATPGIKQHRFWADWPTPEKNWTINSKL